MSILDRVNSPDDLLNLSQGQITQLCAEIREFLIDNVSKTGGHLSSNLGIVELTVAIHRVYDTKKDRIVFDVGHQSYVHKMLTGRRKDFPTLRQTGGMSGFPKPGESVSDAFIAGHASNSISVALGMARARTLLGESYDVAALIGDGALTGGLAYEGLSDAGQSGEPMVVILNDNGMSINQNVGGISKLLTKQRVKPGYLNFKRNYRRIVGQYPALYGALHGVKEWVKAKILPENMFDDLGFYYIGPVDGHNEAELETALRWARDMREPVLLHVITKKGKGYAPAELEPELYHGVGKFDPKVGVRPSDKETFSSVFAAELTELAGKDSSITAITAAMAEGTGLVTFKKHFPQRFFDVGIAEGHAVAMASGMAKQGITPVFAVYSSFLQRGYDMLIHDTALQGLHVVFAVDRAGIVGGDGETHNGAFDVAYLSSVPNMTVLCPSSFAELRAMLDSAVTCLEGPVALRYPRGGEGEYRENHAAGNSALLRDGTDITIVSYGIMINEALKAAEILDERGISAAVLKINRINPLMKDDILPYIRGEALLSVEDVCNADCVGERILTIASENGTPVRRAALLNLGSGILPQGDTAILMKKSGIDGESVARKAEELLEKH